MSEWWAGVLRLDKHVYEAGRVLDLSVPASLDTLRGPDDSIGRLYVRKGFSDLFAQIAHEATPGRWLGHINGNSGVGKSAFLWYFIVRYGIDMSVHGVRFVLLYQSAGFIWELSSNGQVSICRKGAYPLSHFKNAAWHLINQKVESEDPLGSMVLVAASPDSSNIKSTKPDRLRGEFFVYPWDKTEFQALLALWKDESQEMVKRAEELESQLQGPEDTSADEEMESSLTETLCMLSGLSSASSVGWKEKALSLRNGSQLLDSRIEAANLFYSWYGGIPRLLRKAPLSCLNEEEYQRSVASAKTDLAQVTRAVLSNAHSDHICWLLLHFKEPSAGFSRYTLDFASPKIKYMFTETLARTKKEDLNFLLNSSNPELGALRGYIFEQDVVRRLLNSCLGLTLLVDKHCDSCNRRTLEGHRGDTVWIACCVCNNWCHQRCVLPGSEVVYQPWTCAACVAQANQHTIPTRGLLLKYYDGDLETALLAAGTEAASFVWRPLKKNNAAFDFVVLPNILGQATVAEKLPVPVEAVRKGMAALQAWNTEYQACAPKEYLLAFFVMRQNSTNFRYQSYRDKSRRVCDKGVQGIAQVKVVVDTSQWIELQLPAEVVDKLENLDLRQQNLAALTVSELKALAKVWGMSGYSEMRKQELIQEMEAWSARDEEEDRESERSAYKRLYPDRCC